MTYGERFEEALRYAASERVREWVQCEYTRCGNKRHKPCVRGERPHGPYWFHYFTKDGTYTSRYVGKHLDAPAARVLEAHEAKHEAKMALMRGDYLVEIEANGLKGLTPEEVYPERFEDEHREKVLARAAKKREAEAAA